MNRIFLRVIAQLLRLKDFRPKRWQIAAAVFLVVCVFIVGADAAYAQDSDSAVGFLALAIVWLAGFLVTMARVIGLIVVALINLIIVPIMQYNEFSSSPVIGAGWSIVRDTVNIGFVIIMLLIAFGTIIGGSEGQIGKRFAWKQTLPKLLIAAILINFSRMFCGIMIDMAQVIMFTFVNAIKDVAGGNFIQMLGLAEILNLDENMVKNMIKDNDGLKAFDLLGAAFAAVFMMATVLLSLMGIMIILVIRIVMLWILVVLSPIAFFFLGAKQVIGGEMDPYSKWWKHFSATLAIGPVLVFFLWLALAVAGSGSIAAKESFPVSNVPGVAGDELNAASIPIAIFQMDNLISFVIGISMIWVGIDTALKIAESMPGQVSGMVKKLVQPGTMATAIKRGTMGTVGAGVAAGGAAAGLASRGVRGGVGAASWAAKKAKPFASQIPLGQGGKKVGDIGEIAKGRVAKFGEGLKSKGLLGKLAGEAIESKATGSLQEGYKKDREDMSKHTPGFEGKNLEQMMETATGPAYTEEGRAKKRAAIMHIKTKKKFRNQTNAAQMEQLNTESEREGLENIVAGDATMKKDLRTSNLAQAHTMNDEQFTAATANMDDDKEIAKSFDANSITNDSDGRMMQRLNNLQINDRGTMRNGQDYLMLHGSADMRQAIEDNSEDGLTMRAADRLAQRDGVSETDALERATNASHEEQKYMAGDTGFMTAESLAANSGALANTIASDTNNPNKAAALDYINDNPALQTALIDQTEAMVNNPATPAAEVDQARAARHIATSRGNTGGRVSELGAQGPQRQARIEVVLRTKPSQVGQLSQQALNIRRRGGSNHPDANSFRHDLSTAVNQPNMVNNLIVQHQQAVAANNQAQATEVRTAIEQLQHYISVSNRDVTGSVDAAVATAVQNYISTLPTA